VEYPAHRACHPAGETADCQDQAAASAVKKLLRQRRPENFLVKLWRHHVVVRSTMMVIMSGRRDAGRPLGQRCRSQPDAQLWV